MAESWEFNYLHDVDVLMAAFGEDVKPSVQVHLVHSVRASSARSATYLNEKQEVSKRRS